jgi:large exoprotein involved in heme utilization and adhesion
VTLVNPNGMVFGKDSRVDVAGLVATSANVSNTQFMHGKAFTFDRPGRSGATIVNQGNISVKEAGLAALVAPRVVNDGVITAKAGRVALGAGDAVTLDLYGDGLVSLAAPGAQPGQGVTQTGSIVAPGGRVLLTTGEAAGILDRAINMRGLIDVSAPAAPGGEVRLHAPGAEVKIGGAIHADS